MEYAQTIKDLLIKAILLSVTQYGAFVENMNYFSRERKLPIETIVKLLLSMEGGSLNKELHKNGLDVTPSAFVQQRNKISAQMFHAIMQDFNNYCIDTSTYKGYRILAVDSTCVNMPRNPKAESFVSYEGNLKGYNQMHLNPLYDVLNKTYYDCVIQPQPKADEQGAMIQMLYQNNFMDKNIIVADRGYESYNLFAHLQNHDDVDFLIRVKQDKSAMREIAKLPMTELDIDVSFTITNTQTNEDKRENRIFLQKPKKPSKNPNAKTRQGRWDFPSPYPMKLRVVRFMLDTGEYETLATSLPRTFSIEDLKELYHMRWGIETSFRMLKYCIGLINLHGKSDEFVNQEIYSALTMYNFCNRIANAVVIEQKDSNKHEYKVNFTMALYLCKEFFRTDNANGERLMKDIAQYTEPVRLGRQDERYLKAKGFTGFTYRISA